MDTLLMNQDQKVVEPIKADAKRFVRIVRANAESVSPDVAEKLNRFADNVERELREIDLAA